MTTYRQGDILLVPFPFTDQTAVKQRPAVVLSGASYNRDHRDVILAPVTSQTAGRSDEVLIEDWEATGLLNPSAVKPVLSSFDVGLVRRQLGTLSGNDLHAVRALFGRILELI